jgi:hypothetical protein
MQEPSENGKFSFFNNNMYCSRSMAKSRVRQKHAENHMLSYKSQIQIPSLVQLTEDCSTFAGPPVNCF